MTQSCAVDKNYRRPLSGVAYGSGRSSFVMGRWQLALRDSITQTGKQRLELTQVLPESRVFYLGSGV